MENQYKSWPPDARVFFQLGPLFVEKFDSIGRREGDGGQHYAEGARQERLERGMKGRTILVSLPNRRRRRSAARAVRFIFP